MSNLYPYDFSNYNYKAKNLFNSKSQSYYNFSKTEFQDNSTLSSFIKNRKKSTNFSFAGKNNKNKYSIANSNSCTNIKTKFMQTLCNGIFYPKVLKSKKYLKEIKNILPPLTTTTDFFSPNSDYQESISNFNTIYQNKGVELEKNIDRINEGKIDNKFTYNIFKNSGLNKEESKFIKNIIKKNKKNEFLVNFKGKENYDSPTNSLMTLKVNRSLIYKMTQDINNYQYQTYTSIINSHQKDKIKLFMMPKTVVKGIKYHINFYNNNKKGNSSSPKNYQKNNEKQNAKKPLTIDKALIDKINKKLNNGDMIDNRKVKEKKTTQKNEDANDNNNNNINAIVLPENEDLDTNKTIKSTIIRNALIGEIKKYYCKYIPQSNNSNPNSRMLATFTTYYNGLFLYGGMQTHDTSDLWFFVIDNKRYIWEKKIIKNENLINPRSSHTTVLYNESLYIYGGNLNVKKVKYPLEDILIYNIKTNTLKTAQFKNEKNIFNQKYIYIPLRRNHIAHVIGWNMIVYGGVDVLKEYTKENYINYNTNNLMYNSSSKPEQKSENFKHFVLGDFMALDLNTLRWIHLNNIVYKIKGFKKLRTLKNGIPRVYHSSCLVLTPEHVRKGTKLNIYKSLGKLEEEEVDNTIGRDNFEIKYEGIYIFGGLDENLVETNNFFILHCFRNPLVFFEPKIKGTPPSPRCMTSMSFNEILNFITIYGGKDSKQVFGDLFILDIMNFQWFQIELFGTKVNSGRVGHSSEIFNDKLFIFGGCDEDNQCLPAKVMCIELDLIRNKKLGKIYEFANLSLMQNPKDKTAKNVVELLNIGAELPKDIYPLLKLD